MALSIFVCPLSIMLRVGVFYLSTHEQLRFFIYSLSSNYCLKDTFLVIKCSRY